MELNTNPNSKSFWKFVNNVKKCRDPISPQTNWTSFQQSHYLQYLSSHFPPTNSTPIPILPAPKKTPFTFEEFEFVLQKKNKPSASGIDKITYEMIRALNKDSKQNLLKSLNDHWAENKLDDEWRIIRIIPLKKKRQIPR